MLTSDVGNVDISYRVRSHDAGAVDAILQMRQSPDFFQGFYSQGSQ